MRAARGAGLVGVALLALALALPLLWALAASLTPTRELVEGPSLLPGSLTLDHYRALADRGFLAALRTSAVVAASTTLLCVTLGSLCAYALARLPFPGRTAVLAVILAATMFPQIAIVSPLYLLLRAAGLIDTVPGLVLPYLTFAMPLAVWLLTGIFRQIPAELEDAARVDGATRLQTLRLVLLPLALPGVATTAILTFVACWNEFLFALSFTVSPEHRTAPVAIALLRGRHQIPWGQLLAAAVLTTLPVAALVLAFQRRIASGLTAGAVKE